MSAALDIKTEVSGHFAMIVHGGQRGRVVLAEFDNIILNTGLNYVCAGGPNPMQFCQIGTGTSTPTSADASLQAYLAYTGDVQSDSFATAALVLGPPPYKEGSKRFRFAIGAAAGVLAEVGIGWASNGSLWSRARIADVNGAPTTITVLADEQLDVVYTLRAYLPNVDVTGSVTLSGLSYGYKLRTANINDSQLFVPYYLLNLFRGDIDSGAQYTNMRAYSGAIDVNSSYPAGSFAGNEYAGTGVFAAYVNNSFQRAIEFKADLNGCNLPAGIRSIVFRGSGSYGTPCVSYQAEFTAAASVATYGTNIPKDNTKVLKMTLMFSLARRFP